MISKEQIAHDLTMIYMRNLYGIDITGSDEEISTSHLPNIVEPQYEKKGTGKKILFGIEITQDVPMGYKVDNLFSEMTETYFQAYSKFYKLVCNRDEI